MTDAPQRMSFVRFVIIALVSLLLAALVFFALAPVKSSDATAADAAASAAATMSEAAAQAPVPVPATARVATTPASAEPPGRRRRVSGIVAQVENGEAGSRLVTFTAKDAALGPRGVVQDDTTPISPGQPLTLDCLDQGTLMGEPLWTGCHVVQARVR